MLGSVSGETSNCDQIYLLVVLLMADNCYKRR